MTDVARCRACNAPIIWTETAHGKRMPLDEDPDSNGLFMLVEQANDRTPAAIYARPSDPPGERFTSHFSTCPRAQEFRR